MKSIKWAIVRIKPPTIKKKRDKKKVFGRCKKISLIIAIAGLIIAIFTSVIPWVSTSISPIVVSPNVIKLTEKPWDLNTYFSVQNRTNDALFSIWIKVAIYDCDIKSENIFIDAEGTNELLEYYISSIYINYSYVRLNGRNDKGIECIYFIIHQLPPKSTEMFIIKSDPYGNTTRDSNPYLSIEVLSHSDNPKRLLQCNNEISYNITPPEAFTLKSFVFLMRRE